jgi:hypothetical protein
MNKYVFLFFTIIATACNQPGNNSGTAKDTAIVISADTIPEERSTIKPDAVASYREKVPDELNDWQFAVSLYETHNTFKYLVRIQYKELRITDSIMVPDFGMQPKVAIHQGKEPRSCILGFLDKKGHFREYRLVRIKNDKLKSPP